MNIPPLRGLHHVKFPVYDLERSMRFYEMLFRAERIPALDHKLPDGSVYAHIMEVPELGTRIELRLNPAQADQQREFDPVTIAVDDRPALEAWGKRLDELRIDHSPIIVSIQAWLLVFHDPDRRRLRFYTLESHGPEVKPEPDSPWVK